MRDHSSRKSLPNQLAPRARGGAPTSNLADSCGVMRPHTGTHGYPAGNGSWQWLRFPRNLNLDLRGPDSLPRSRMYLWSGGPKVATVPPYTSHVLVGVCRLACTCGRPASCKAAGAGWGVRGLAGAACQVMHLRWGSPTSRGARYAGHGLRGVRVPGAVSPAARLATK